MAVPLLQVVNLRKTFPSGNEIQRIALDGVSLSAAAGDCVAILGTNGSGKSTLLNIVAGTLDSDEGDVVVDGCSLAGVPQAERSRDFGKLEQDTRSGLFPSYSVEDNLLLALLKGHRPSCFHWLGNRRARLESRAILERHAPELVVRLDSTPDELSGGERQLLALACVLATSPRFLLLDEPTASLDPRNAKRILEGVSLYIAQRKAAALLVTHSVAHALERGTHVLLLHQGRVRLGCSRGDTSEGELAKLFSELERDVTPHA